MESAKELAEGSEAVGELAEYTYKDLEIITDGFNDENCIGKTQYGKLFHGKVQRGSQTEDVIVKMLIVEPTRKSNLDIQLSRIELEKKLLTNAKYSHHENLPKLIGYCIQNEHLGSVYELRPLDTLHNLITKDDFKWMDRIKVAYRFARLLEFLYGEQVKIRNIDARHVVIDKGFNPKLLDFSMIAGGVFGNTLNDELVPSWSVGYCDPHLCMTGDDSWSDIYAFDLILLALISKRVVFNQEEKATLGQKSHIRFWAGCEYRSLKGKHKSLVHKSLEEDPFYNTRDGVEITKLVWQCGEQEARKRLTIHEIVLRLKALLVARHFL